MWISIILFSIDIIWNNWLTQWRSPGSAPGENHHLWLDTRLSAGRFTSEVGWCLRFWQRKCHIVVSCQHSWQEVEGLRRAPLTLYLWKASLPGCQHQPPDFPCRTTSVVRFTPCFSVRIHLKATILASNCECLLMKWGYSTVHSWLRGLCI